MRRTIGHSERRMGCCECRTRNCCIDRGLNARRSFAQERMRNRRTGVRDQSGSRRLKPRLPNAWKAGLLPQPIRNLAMRIMGERGYPILKKPGRFQGEPIRSTLQRDDVQTGGLNRAQN
jgi:hypothetical protein